MPKKSRARRSIKQTQKQEQRQNINIKIGELPTKKPRRRRPRKGPTAPGREAPLRQLPPVVYQTLPQLTYYGKPNELGTITGEPAKSTSIVEPVKAKTTILEDVGMVGTEGPVEILERPTKKETLAELISPVESPFIDRPVKLPKKPKATEDIAEPSFSFDIPRIPMEEPSMSALFREQKQTTIVEPPMQQFPITEMEASFETKSIKRTEEPRMVSGVESLVFADPVKTGIVLESVSRKPRSQSVKPRSQSVKPQKLTQADINKFLSPRMQPFVAEKAKIFESGSPQLISNVSPPIRSISPKPGLKTREGPTIRIPKPKSKQVL
jgi:hypothetical protein